MSRDEYRTLPEPVRLEDTVEEIDARAVPAPDAGTNRDHFGALEAGG
jgi:hypothetical protein